MNSTFGLLETINCFDIYGEVVGIGSYCFTPRDEFGDKKLKTIINDIEIKNSFVIFVVSGG